jgi:hypothetical protein
MASVVEAFDRLTMPAQSLETGARGAGTTSSGLLSSLIRPWIALGLLVAASASVAAGFLAGPSIFLHFLHEGPTRRVPQDRDTPQAYVAKTVAKSGAPKSGAPKTDVPKTDVPRTDVPRTDAPRTDVPRTDVPRTDVPRTDVPRTDKAKTDVPNTDLPNTDLAKADVPKADVPRTDVPRTDVPRTDVPRTDMPKTDMPKTDMPKTDMPKTEVPNTDVPDLAKTDVPKTDMFEVATADVPKTDVPEVAKTDVPDVPKADVAKTEVPKSDEAKTDVAKTDVTSAKLPERSPDQPQSTGPDAMMVLEELRAPARLSCIDVLFSGAAPEVHVLTAAGGRFPPSSTAGLCGLRARVTAPGAANRAPAYKVDFDAAFLAISMPAQDDPGSRALGRSSRMFRRDAPAHLSYRIVMRSLPGAANPLELQFTHELRK